MSFFLHFRRKLLAGLVAANLVVSMMPGFGQARIVYETEEGATNSESFTIDFDDSATSNIDLRFGDSISEVLRFDVSSDMFVFTDDLSVGGDLSLSGTVVTIDQGATSDNTIRIVADQGIDNDGELRYNPVTDRWEISNDGALFGDIAINNQANADTLDNLDSTQFLRSDTSDNYTSGTLTLDAGTTMQVSGVADLSGASDIIIPNTESNTFILDNDNTGGDVRLQFGQSLAEALLWNATAGDFLITDDLSLNNNEVLDARVENVSALPGGASGLGAGGTGRIVQLTAPDSTAPGCTISPNCGTGPYLWDGSAWVSMSGVSTSNTLTKVVTVGSSNSDYTQVSDAAAYLQTRSGGFMLLAAETHAITQAIDLTNVTIFGKDASNTTMQVTGAGQLDTFDTAFKFLTLDVDAITDDMAMDVQSGSNSLRFEFVDFNVQDSGDSLIDSNAGGAPTVTMKFVKSNSTGGSGAILKSMGAGNLNAASSIFVDSRSGDTPLEMNDWSLILAGGGSVNTTGVITSVPAQSIFVSPDMNLQGAIDSLEFVGNGGLITLLPGTHTISQPLTIEDDDIRIEGYGDASIISASGFASTGETIGAIQVGAADGTSPVDNVVLKDFRLEVGTNPIHGIRVTGGQDNQIDNVTVQKTSGTSGTAATADIGIQMIDGTAEELIRPVVRGSRVLGNGGTIFFTDGIHVTSDPDIGGVFGNDQGVTNALVEGNNVDYVRETGYVFVGASNSSLFNNRSSRMGAGGGGAYGIFMGNVSNVNMSANVFTGSLSTASIALGIESFNTGSNKQTLDSIFDANVVDGFADSGVGFGTGFQIGNATNADVLRNSFQNNIVTGAAAAVTVAFDIRGNSDDNTFSNNSIAGGTNAWDTGFNLQAAAQERNIIRGNRPTNVTALIADSGTATILGVDHHRSTTDPTVNDDINDGYNIGTIWINTTDDQSFIMLDETAGAAVWRELGETNTENYLYFDLHGAIRSSAGTGSVAGGQSPVIRFDATDTSRARWSFPVPDDWVSGTDMTLDIFWSPADASAGNVNFDLEYGSFAPGETIAGGSFTSATLAAQPAPGTTLELVQFPITLSAATFAANDMVNFRISRVPGDASDTYGDDANIHMVRIRYTNKQP